jgi:hypothetical protein
MTGREKEKRKGKEEKEDKRRGIKDWDTPISAPILPG